MQIQVVQKSTASRPRDMWPLCMRTLSSFELGPLKNQDIYRFLLNFGDKQIICDKLCELWPWEATNCSSYGKVSISPNVTREVIRYENFVEIIPVF